MTDLGAIFTAIGESCKLFLTLFAARNTPAMQAAARAATMAKIRASVTQHIATGDLNSVRTDGSP